MKAFDARLEQIVEIEEFKRGDVSPLRSLEKQIEKAQKNRGKNEVRNYPETKYVGYGKGGQREVVGRVEIVRADHNRDDNRTNDTAADDSGKVVGKR